MTDEACQKLFTPDSRGGGGIGGGGEWHHHSWLRLLYMLNKSNKNHSLYLFSSILLPGLIMWLGLNQTQINELSPAIGMYGKLSSKVCDTAHVACLCLFESQLCVVNSVASFLSKTFTLWRTSEESSLGSYQTLWLAFHMCYSGCQMWDEWVSPRRSSTAVRKPLMESWPHWLLHRISFHLLYLDGVVDRVLGQ